jgi:hypothetical protein
MQRTRPDHFAAGGGGRQQTAADRLTALIEARGGVEAHDRHGLVYSKGLRCPLCLKSGLRITLGDKPETLMAFCEACKAHGPRLVKAIWEMTGISLSPMPKRWRPSPEAAPERVIAEMRQSEKYQALSARAKTLVDYIADAVINGLPNGHIDLTGAQLMALLKTRSWKHLYKAVNAAKDAGIVVCGSRARTLNEKGGAPNLWGLTCLPRWESTKTKRGGRVGGENRPKGGRTRVF